MTALRNPLPRRRSRTLACNAAAHRSSGVANFSHFPLAFACQHDDQPRGLLDSHGGIVDKDGIGGAHERRNFALAIALVALFDFLKNFSKRQLVTFFPVLFPAPLRAHFRGRIQKNLELSEGRSEEHTSELQSHVNL